MAVAACSFSCQNVINTDSSFSLCAVKDAPYTVTEVSGLSRSQDLMLIIVGTLEIVNDRAGHCRCQNQLYKT